MLSWLSQDLTHKIVLIAAKVLTPSLGTSEVIVVYHDAVLVSVDTLLFLMQECFNVHTRARCRGMRTIYVRVDALAQVQGNRPTKAPVTPRPEKNPRPPVGIGSDTRQKGSSGRRARGASSSADSGPRPRRHCQAFERAPARPPQRPGKHPGAPRRAPLGCGRSAPSLE